MVREAASMTETKMILRIPCRYYRVYTNLDVPCREENFHFVEQVLPISAEQAALVVVDVWATHYIDSTIARARRITAEKIVPVIAAARQAGVAVIHAPSPWIVEKQFPEYKLPATDEQPASGGAEWPPREFRGIYRGGEYAAFGRPWEPILDVTYKRYETELRVAPAVLPVEGDYLISTGAQLHALLAEKGILHLFYVGFNTNWCVLGRDYGIIAMNERGYNAILIRDATTGIEGHDTVDELTATDMAIREVETKHGWTTDTAAFLAASAAQPT